MAMNHLSRDVLRRAGTSSKPSPLLCCGAASTSYASPAVHLMPQRRQLHGLPRTPANVSQGCMPFLSKSTVDLLWEGWQNGLLERLNAEVKGTEQENSSLVDTIISAAEKPDRIMAFNYASQALNNAFFLSQLRSPPGTSQDPSSKDYLDREPPAVPQELAREISAQWGSVTAFKSAFSSAALGMSSSGYVWLVRDQAHNLGIVPTFGAGTVLVHNRIQRGPEDLQSLAAVDPAEQARQAEEEAARQSESGSSRSVYSPGLEPRADRASSLGFNDSGSSEALRILGRVNSDTSAGQGLSPLLCLSVYEHAWLPDWGIWGKETYLARFWEVVDWTKVQELWKQGEMKALRR